MCDQVAEQLTASPAPQNALIPCAQAVFHRFAPHHVMEDHQLSPEAAAAAAGPRDAPQDSWDAVVDGVRLTREQVQLILSCNELMALRLERLHAQRRELCLQLEQLAAASGRAAGLAARPAAAAAAASPTTSTSTCFGVGAAWGGAAQTPPRGVSSPPPVQQGDHDQLPDAHYHHHAGPPGADGAELDHMGAFAAQSEIVEELSANTERMGAIMRLHQQLIYCIFTDAQRARLRAAVYPAPLNAGKCVVALQRAVAARPGAFPGAEAADLRGEQAAWAAAEGSGSVGAAPGPGGAEEAEVESGPGGGAAGGGGWEDEEEDEDGVGDDGNSVSGDSY
jgi:hypothetical protein